MKNKNIARIRLPKDIKPCPFCGSKSLRGWKKCEVKSEVKSETKKAYNGRTASITCGGCGVGVDFGWFGNGISDASMKRYMIEDWNKRASDDNNGIG